MKKERFLFGLVLGFCFVLCAAMPAHGAERSIQVAGTTGCLSFQMSSDIVNIPLAFNGKTKFIGTTGKDILLKQEIKSEGRDFLQSEGFITFVEKKESLPVLEIIKAISKDQPDFDAAVKFASISRSMGIACKVIYGQDHYWNSVLDPSTKEWATVDILKGGLIEGTYPLVAEMEY